MQEISDWQLWRGERNVTAELVLCASTRPPGDWDIYHHGRHVGHIRDGRPTLFHYAREEYELLLRPGSAG